MKPPIRILVVEDDADLLRATCRTLVQASYAVGAASAGAEVLPALREQPAHLVLLDWQLPDVDGLEICRQIKADPALTGVFVLIISGVHKGSDDRVAGLEALADGYIERPISNRELLARVEAFARIVRLNQSLAEQAEALRASEERYRTLFDRANEGICLLSANGDLVSVNESFARMHGYRVEEMLPRNLQALNTPETAALVPAQLRRLLAGESLTFEVEHYHQDGHVFPLEVSASLISVGGENFLQCFHRDITERQQAAALGSKSAARHRAILQTAMDGFWLTDLEGRFLEVNDTYCQMSGYSVPELLAMRIPDLEATEAAADTAAHLQKVMAQGEDRFQSQHRRKDGSVFEVEVSVQYQPADGGRFVVFVRDITERQRAEESLRLDNQIMANMADGVYLIRECDGVIVYANDRFEQMFGYAPGELLGQPVSVVNAPAGQSPEATAQAIMAELGRSGTWEGEVHNVKKDGTTFWCQARVTAFVHGRYGPVWISLHTDITARKLAEENLRVHQVELQMQNEELRRSQVELDAQRARYFDLFDLAPVGYVTISEPGLILEANVTVAGLLGVVRGALLRQLFSRFILQEDTDSYYLLRKQLFATGTPQTCELRMVNRDGTPFWVHLAVTVAQDAAGAPVCRVTLSDITTRKQAEAALRESQERFQLSMEATSDGLWDWNIKTNAGYFSPTYYRMLGYEPSDFAMAADAWQCLMHPDDRERSLKANQDCIEGRCEHFAVEFRLQAKSGEWRWILGRGKCIERDAQGRALRLVGTHMDITQRKQTEAAFRNILDNMQDAYVRTDQDGRFIMVNPATVRMYGYDSAADLIGLPAAMLYAEPANRDALFAELHRAGFVSDYVGRGRRRDGGTFWVSLNAHFYRDAAGNVLGSEGFMRDITERKQAEEKLRTSEARYRGLFEHMAEGYAACQMLFENGEPQDFIYLAVNQAFETLTGLHQVTGRKVSEVIPGIRAADPQLFALYARVAMTGKPEKSELFVAALQQWLSLSVYSQEEGCFVAVFDIITARKQAEAALRESEATFRALTDTLPLAIYLSAGVEQVSEYVSPTMVKLFGYTKADIPCVAQWWPLAYPDATYRRQIAAEWTRRVEHSLATQSPIEPMETVVTCKDGSQRYVSWGFITLGEKNYAFGLDLTERNRAEQAVNREQALSKAIIDSIPGAFYVLDETGRYARWNAYQRDEIVGQSEDRVAGMDAAATVHPDDRALVQSRIGNVLAHGLDETVEGRVLLRGGPAYRWLLMTGRQMMIEGRPFLVGIGIDITERKQAGEKLRESETRYRTLIENVGEGIGLVDPQDHFTFANPAGDRIFGVPRGGLLGRSLREFTTPEQFAVILEQNRQREAGATGLYEIDIIRPDGRTCALLVTAVPQYDSEGKFAGTFGVFRDISDRKQAEVALKESEQRLQLVLQGSYLGFWDWNLETNEVKRNELWAEMLGYQLDEVEFSVKQWVDFVHPDDRARAWQSIQDHIEGRTPRHRLEYRMRAKDGHYRWILDQAQVVVRDANQRAIRMCGTHADITERKQTEEALRETNAYLENLMNNANGPIVVWDPHFHITRFNLAFESLTGRLAAEVLGQSLETLFPPALVESLMSLIKWTTGGERWESVEIPILHRDGTTRTVLWNSATLFSPDGQTPVATIAQGQDITARVAVEDRLRLLTRALEAAANGVTITDAGGTILWVNAAFTTLTGYSVAEAVGQNPRLLKSGQHDLAFYRAMQAEISSGRVWHGEITNRRKDGSLYREEMTITPVRQGTGPITHFIAIKQDITARQQAEEERSRLEVQLRQAQKLESIGQLAAGIAHEINTPTQYIGDNTRFLQDAFKDISQALSHYDRLLQAARQQRVTPELVASTAAAAEAADIAYLTQEVPKSIEQTLQGVARVAKIVRAMKDFSHPGSEAKVPADLNRAIESTITVAHNEWKYVADLDLALDPQLPPVPCLPGEINQVILNLLINAAHAIGDVVGDGASGKGRIRVSTSRQGDWAEIRVQDSGTGIPEAARGRIFDPFFTTKAVGKGTGQGLTIAHSVVVKQHGGTIEFETELGKGTTFIVRLPLLTAPATPKKNLRTPEPPQPSESPDFPSPALSGTLSPSDGEREGVRGSTPIPHAPSNPSHESGSPNL